MKVQQQQQQQENPTQQQPPPYTVHLPSSSPSPDSTPNHVFSPPQEYIKPPPDTSSPPPRLTNLGPTVQDGFVGGGGEEVEVGGGGGGGGGGGSKRLRPGLSILKRVKRDSMVKKILLGFRIFGFVSCLVSFSVMAANRDQGWALDSFYRYKEFRYCMAINVIAFAYSVLQAYDLAYQLTTRKFAVQNRLRYYLDFSMD